MRFDLLLFATVLGMCAVLVGAYVVPERPVDEIVQADGAVVQVARGHGVPNPDFGTMLSGGDGEARYESTWRMGLAFGLLQVVFFVGALAFGATKRAGLGPLKLPFIVGGVAYAGVFVAMVVSHRAYAASDSHPLVLGFPIPTAWMMYGVWLVPLVFMFAYLFLFDSWIYTEEDRKRFERLLAEQGPRPES